MTRAQTSIYKPLIFILLLSFLAFSAWSAWQASHLGSQVTDRDYYSKGLKYNTTLVEKRAAEVLGWTVTPQIDQRTLTLALHDTHRDPVSGAQVVISFYHPTLPEDAIFPLSEVAAGRYQLDLPADLSGSVRAAVRFERDQARLTRQMQINF